MRTKRPAPGTGDEHATLALAAFDPGLRGGLAWRQPRLARRQWLLLADGTACAALENRGLLGAGWSLRTAQGTWRFRSHWLGGISALAEGAAEPIARFRPGWWLNGHIERPGQATLDWTRTSFWRSHWVIETSDGLALVRFAMQRRFLRFESVVEMEDAGRRLPDLLPLIGLGWILSLYQGRGHSAAH